MQELVMYSDRAVTAYQITEPFERALRMVREALCNTDLQVVTELDVTARVKRELNIGFGPCRVLLVDSPCLLLEAATLDRSAMVLLPLHVVLNGHGAQTLVHWMSPTVLGGVRLPVGAAAPMLKLQALVARAIEQVAMRRDTSQLA